MNTQESECLLPDQCQGYQNIPTRTPSISSFKSPPMLFSLQHFYPSFFLSPSPSLQVHVHLNFHWFMFYIVFFAFYLPCICATSNSFSLLSANLNSFSNVYKLNLVANIILKHCPLAAVLTETNVPLLWHNC